MLQLMRKRGVPAKPSLAFTEPRGQVFDFDHALDNAPDLVALLPEADRYEVYISLAHFYNATTTQKPVIHRASFEYQEVLPFRIHRGEWMDPLTCKTRAAVIADVLGVGIDDLTVISYGYGFEAFVKLKTPVRRLREFSELALHYRAICGKIDTQIREMTTLQDACDASIFHPEAIFRAPGSTNHVLGQEAKPVEVIQRGPVAPFDLDLAEISGLASDETDSAKGAGYWLLGEKGKPYEPAYLELCHLFEDMHPYVTMEQGQVMTYRGLHYQPIDDLAMKGWLEKQLNPQAPLRERHRYEFVSRIKSTGADPDHPWKQLVSNTEGKIPFLNGVFDVASGRLLDHSPQFGFTYCLPHPYNPDFHSEYFQEWALRVMGGDATLLQTLYDVMSYTLWPRMDDHALVFLSGDGSNGKSTLLEILRVVLGETNCANVSIDQLVNNRFAPAQMDGKMANLSPENSGGDLSSGDLNKLKVFSENSTVMVEQKGKEGYSMRNTAKQIYAMNKPPNIREDSYAIQRRAIVIPFNHTFEKMDPRVGRRLIEDEIQGITALLVSNLQLNIRKNNGNFKISRESAAMQEAKRHLLDGRDTAKQWAKEFIIPYPGKGIPTSLAYHHYVNWCQESGIKNEQNVFNFKTNVRSALGLNPGENPRLYLGGKQVKAFEDHALSEPSQAYETAMIKQPEPRNWQDKEED